MLDEKEESYAHAQDAKWAVTHSPQNIDLERATWTKDLHPVKRKSWST